MLKSWRIGAICVCLCLLMGCQSAKPPQGLMGKIERVISGQTLEWVDTSKPTGLIERVRLIGIESPDMRQQPWGIEAKKALEQMIGETQGQQLVLQRVVLESDVAPLDSYGRRLAYVWKGGILLNEQLVKEGYVLAVPRSPNQKYDLRLIRAQEYARLMGKGIWNPEKPMRLTPSEFQRQNR
jgi:micrococcal nuclease